MLKSKKIKFDKFVHTSLLAFIPFFLFANPQVGTVEEVEVEAEIEKLIQLETSKDQLEERATTSNDENPKPPEICVFPVCRDQ